VSVVRIRPWAPLILLPNQQFEISGRCFTTTQIQGVGNILGNSALSKQLAAARSSPGRVRAA
jgi:hypothetical protein